MPKAKLWGKSPGMWLSAATAFLKLPMPWASSPASSAALRAPAHPLCAQNAPDANTARPLVERSLASVEDRESPLLSVIDRQFRRQCDLNHTSLALAASSPRQDGPGRVTDSRTHYCLRTRRPNGCPGCPGNR